MPGNSPKCCAVLYVDQALFSYHVEYNIELCQGNGALQIAENNVQTQFWLCHAHTLILEMGREIRLARYDRGACLLKTITLPGASK